MYQDDQRVFSKGTTSSEGLDIIKNQAPFHIYLPNDTSNKVLRTANMISASKEDLTLKNTDLIYNTSDGGKLHIWETNVQSDGKNKVPMLNQVLSYKTVRISNHDWYYTVNGDTRIFATHFEKLTVEVDGTLSYDALVQEIENMN